MAWGSGIGHLVRTILLGSSSISHVYRFRGRELILQVPQEAPVILASFISMLLYPPEQFPFQNYLNYFTQLTSYELLMTY